MTVLVDAGFHKYIHEVILSDPIIANRKTLSEMYGESVLGPLIKNKKYRKELTDFIDQLRTSKNFRDRQMYICIGLAVYK